MTLRLRELVLDPTPAAPLVMGIVNASPESFSNGGETGGAAEGRALAAAGARIVDVGGESGVTDRPPVSAAEEIRRVVPVVEELAAEGHTVSVDTWKPEVARAVLAAGAALVNDVSGLRDPALAEACAEHGAGLVIMHTRAEPKVKAFPHYDDVRADVRAFLEQRMGLAMERGVGEESIVLDPGPDFAKTPPETVEVLRGLPDLAGLGRPILLAVSRKDFIGAVTGRPPGDRLGGTLAAVGAGLDAGASMVRVHDVPEVVDYLKVRAALRGEERIPDMLDPALRRG